MTDETMTTFAWLIERGQTYGHETPVYYRGPGDRWANEWTSDPWAAQRFRSRAEAESVIRKNSAAGHSFGGAVEHGFTTKPSALSDGGES